MAYGKQYLHLTRRSARWIVLPPPFISLRLCHIVCLTGWFIVWESEPQYLIDTTALIPLNSQDFKQYSNLYSRYLSPPCAEIRPTARQNQPRAVVRNYNNNNNERKGSTARLTSAVSYCSWFLRRYKTQGLTENQDLNPVAAILPLLVARDSIVSFVDGLGPPIPPGEGSPKHQVAPQSSNEPHHDLLCTDIWSWKITIEFTASATGYLRLI